jgi:hypothetical protein
MPFLLPDLTSFEKRTEADILLHRRMYAEARGHGGPSTMASGKLYRQLAITRENADRRRIVSTHTSHRHATVDVWDTQVRVFN